ncbi:MAG: hypothetical protein ACR2HD_11510 [Solirubrobacteraceae bacterium]|nr:MAG: hypothetical protein DLM63_09780 [Solirubrobacterales bacterium]
MPARARIQSQRRVAPPSQDPPRHEPSRPAGLRERGAGAVTGAASLVVLMAVGSVALWIGAPLSWLWLASRLQHGPNPSFGPYLLVAFGMPTTMFIIGKGLAALDRAFADVTGYDPIEQRVPLPWLKSMRGERVSGRRRTVLDVIMIVSVTVALVVGAIWFLFFAHLSNPLP